MSANTTSTAKRRYVFSIGDVGMSSANTRSPSPVGKHLAALIEAADVSGSSTRSAGPSYGIELLRIASTGASTATLGAHPAFQHVPHLDEFVRLQGHSGTSVNIVKAVSGQHHSLLLLSLGQLLLVSPDASENGTAVTLRTSSQDDAAATGVQDVAAGRTHFVACTDSGSVYTFGWSNEFGQLGDGTVWRVDHASGAAAPPLLTDPRRIPGFGISSVSNADAALGAPPTPLIIAVAAGDHHTVLLAASKTAVYTCGRGHRGQLGTCRKVELSTSFHVIQKLFGAWTSAIAAAADHTILLLDTGKLVAFGDNTTGAACTGASQSAIEPQEAAWIGEEDAATAAPKTVKNASAESDATTPIACASAPSSSSTKRRAADSKAMESIKAPYGSIESYLYPRRVYRFPTAVNSTYANAKVVDSVVTSPTLTIATTVDQELFSAGLRVTADPVKQRADGRGPLGRHTVNSQGSRQLGQVSLRRCSTSSIGGWRAICGRGFAAYWDTVAGIVRIHGSIGSVISSLDPAHVSTYQAPADDSLQLDVGGSHRRVVSAVAVQRGMLLVVEES
jgi:hypothetical protein